ncbi:MAG: SHOCT domain-containing protein [Mesobacillus sp.]
MHLLAADRLWFIGLLLAGFLSYLLMINKKGPDQTIRSDSSEAMEQLKTRLAQGDITPEEYQKMKDIVSK